MVGKSSIEAHCAYLTLALAAFLQKCAFIPEMDGAFINPRLCKMKAYGLNVSALLRFYYHISTLKGLKATPKTIISGIMIINMINMTNDHYHIAIIHTYDMYSRPDEGKGKLARENSIVRHKVLVSPNHHHLIQIIQITINIYWRIKIIIVYYPNGDNHHHLQGVSFNWYPP